MITRANRMRVEQVHPEEGQGISPSPGPQSVQTVPDLPIARRRQGRPRKDPSDKSSEMSCPFADPSRDNPCRAYAKPKRRAYVRDHLFRIRTGCEPGEIGGNATHPKDDPLWDTEEMRLLLRRRGIMTEEEKKSRLRQKNHESYLKSKEKMEQTKAEVAEYVAEGKLDQAEADNIIRSRLRGYYRAQFENEIIARASSQCQENYSHLKAQTLVFRERFTQLSDSAQLQHTILTQCFNRPDEAMLGGFLERNNVSWPTQPSIFAFWLIYCLAVPISSWPVDSMDSPIPDVNACYKAAALAVHPDKADQERDILGRELRNNITSILNASRDLVLEALPSNPIEDSQVARWWEFTKYKVLTAMQPKGEFPPYFISFLVDQAASNYSASQQIGTMYP